jgi:hypothetical protein
MYEYYQFAMNMFAGQQVDFLACMAFAIMYEYYQFVMNIKYFISMIGFSSQPVMYGCFLYSM